MRLPVADLLMRRQWIAGYSTVAHGCLGVRRNSSWSLPLKQLVQGAKSLYTRAQLSPQSYPSQCIAYLVHPIPVLLSVTPSWGSMHCNYIEAEKKGEGEGIILS